MNKEKEFFRKYQTLRQKQYEALRAFFVNGEPGKVVARRFKYKLSSFYSLTRDFKKNLHNSRTKTMKYFFSQPAIGRPPIKNYIEQNFYKPIAITKQPPRGFNEDNVIEDDIPYDN